MVRITVTAALVNKANRALTSAEATTAYTDYNAIAKVRLDNDDPGLTTAIYDWCHALLICHIYAAGDPTSGLKSFTTGDFSGTQIVGRTIWMIEYLQIIGEFTDESSDEKTDENSVGRCDAEMADFKFDQGTIPRYFSI
ncbi:hypothetical protein D4R86_05725 [bacterium]|nr:MAG: hypothetical protein D4R86_05725 [bacterium]